MSEKFNDSKWRRNQLGDRPITEGVKSNIMQKWDKVGTIQDDLRLFIQSATGLETSSDLLRDLADTLKVMSNYAMGEYKKSKRG